MLRETVINWKYKEIVKHGNIKTLKTEAWKKPVMNKTVSEKNWLDEK